MVDFEKDLKNARDLFEKRLQTLRRIKSHIRHLSKSADEYSAGKIALKIAKSELHSARHKLDDTIQGISQNAHVNSSTEIKTNSLNGSEPRDHFSEALARVDPKSRLQLGL